MEGETDRGKDGVYMENGWMKQVADKLKRQNQILFSRDSACLQELLELIRQQPHRVLVDWAFTCVERPLEILEAHLPREDRPRTAVETCRRWAAGEVKMPQAKRALLQAHQAAKGLDSPEDIALCHAVGQACAVVHVETHAIGLPIYELTAIVRGAGFPDCRKPVERRIGEYAACLQRCRAEAPNPERKWAAFLLDDSRPNKELLLARKLGKTGPDGGNGHVS